MRHQVITTKIRSDSIGVLILNRPEKRNALSILLRREISATLAKWSETEDIGAVVVTGAGDCFSAGFDLDEFQKAELAEELFESSSRYHRDLWTFPKPVIAAINGPAMGGGFDLTTLCDIRICSDTASFGHPEIKFGAPPLFTPLRWIVGDGRARELCLTGRKIDAGEAYRIGLVSEVVQGNPLEKALRLATAILEAPLPALRFAKEMFSGSGGRGFEYSFALEHDRAFRELILKRFGTSDR